MRRGGNQFDVIVVGGGPAGLSAALVLGRCRRRVLVFDAGQPRNAAARAMHGYLSRDGVNPLELLKIARDQLKPYGIEIRHGEVRNARRLTNSFEVHLDQGAKFRARKLLLATGVRDALPEIDGLQEMYGVSVHHCPYCDGWEWRDRPLAVFGRGNAGSALALKLKNWSADVVLCSSGRSRLSTDQQRKLARRGIEVRDEPIVRLEGRNGRLQRLVFSDGATLARAALFFATGQGQRSDLARRLGCEIDRHGGVKVYRREGTCVPGLYVVGDASRDMQFVIVAAAEGANAAVAINNELLKEDGLLF